MVIHITKEEVKEYEKLKIISKLSLVNEKLGVFEGKYKCSFEEFEKKINTQREEDFEMWDDYIEWTAYVETKKTLTKKMAEIDNVQDIRIS